jgi:hypothetical protein
MEKVKQRENGLVVKVAFPKSPHAILMLRLRERTLLDVFRRVEVQTEDVTHPERDALLEVP